MKPEYAIAALLCLALLTGCQQLTDNPVPTDPVPGNPVPETPETAYPYTLREGRSARLYEESSAVDEMPDITNGKSNILPPPAAWDYAPPGEDLPRGTRGGIDGQTTPGELVDPPIVGDSSLEMQVFDLVNAYRFMEGLDAFE